MTDDRNYEDHTLGLMAEMLIDHELEKRDNTSEILNYLNEFTDWDVAALLKILARRAAGL